jgi:hypothetical protein
MKFWEKYSRKSAGMWPCHGENKKGNTIFPPMMGF